MSERPVSSQESLFIRAIADQLSGDAHAQLLDDLANATVEIDVSDDARTKFALSNYDRPEYRGQHPYSSEGWLLAQDGAELSAVLHADQNGRLLEIEFIRWDDAYEIDPDWSTLEIVDSPPLKV